MVSHPTPYGYKPHHLYYMSLRKICHNHYRTPRLLLQLLMRVLNIDVLSCVLLLVKRNLRFVVNVRPVSPGQSCLCAVQFCLGHFQFYGKAITHEEKRSEPTECVLRTNIHTSSGAIALRHDRKNHFPNLTSVELA